MVVNDANHAILTARYDSLRQQLEATQRDLRKERDIVSKLEKVAKMGDKERFAADDKLRKYRLIIRVAQAIPIVSTCRACCTALRHKSALYRLKTEPLPLLEITSDFPEANVMTEELAKLSVSQTNLTKPVQ